MNRPHLRRRRRCRRKPPHENPPLELDDDFCVASYDEIADGTDAEKSDENDANVPAPYRRTGKRGAATIGKEDDTWSIRGSDRPATPVDAVSHDVAASLGVRSGATFTADPSDIDAGTQLKDVLVRADEDQVEGLQLKVSCAAVEPAPRSN